MLFFKEVENGLEHITKTITKHYPEKNPIFKELYSIHENINPGFEKERFEKAFFISELCHRGQNRYSGEPFFAHECRTAYLCNVLLSDSNVTLIGQLHDTVEDSKKPYNYALEIYNSFGKDVFFGVMGLSRLKSSTDQFGRLQAFRENFVSKIGTAKLSDAWDNLLSVKYLPSRSNKSAKERQLDYLNSTRDNVIPIAKDFDKRNNKNVSDYIFDLIESNYKRLK